MRKPDRDPDDYPFELDLDKSSFVPIYYQIMEYLREQITKGTTGFEPGEKIIPEVTLAKRLKVNVRTVRKAIAELTKEGILMRGRGKGTFVCEGKDQLRSRKLRIGFLADSELTLTATWFLGQVAGARANLMDQFHDMRTELYSLDKQSDMQKVCEDLHGIIVIGELVPKPVFKALKDIGIPCIATMVDMTSEGHSSVIYDAEHDAYEMTKHFIDTGHRKIALINSKKNLLRNRRAINGYKRALQEADISFREDYYKEVSLSHDNGHAATQTFLKLADAPTAVANTAIAIARGSVHGAQDLNLEVPGDVSISAWADEKEIVDDFRPKLSGVRIKFSDLGVEAGRLMVQLIEGQDSGVSCIKLRGRHVVADSTRAL